MESYIVFFFISLSIIASRFIHAVACDMIFFLFKAEWYSVYVLHFVYPTIYWWTVGLLPFLDNCEYCCYSQKCADNHFEILISRSHSFGYICISRIVESYGGFVFNFWGTSVLFSIVAAPFYIPITIAEGCQFLHILTNTSPPPFGEGDVWKKPSRWVFIWFRFAFLWWLVTLSIFSYFWPFVYHLWRNVYSCGLHIFYQVLFCCPVVGVLYILDLNPLPDICFLYIFFHSIVCFSFYIFDCFLWCIEVF